MGKYTPRQGEKMTLSQILAWIGVILVGLFIIGFASLIILIAVVSIGLPNIHDLDKLAVSESTTIYDREGNVLYVKHGGENRQYVPFDQISEHVTNATVSVEDEAYWEHPGFDPFGIARAFINNVFRLGPQQGGSTITQQYIKNAFLSSERTYTRKIKELILAIQLEQAYDKEKILELYLNKIPYGNNAYGIEKAAQVYFDKHASDLDLAESAILSALPKAPSYYNPYGPNKFTELTKQFTEEELDWRTINSESGLKQNEISRGLIGQDIALGENKSVYVQGRTDMVLKAMAKNGYITETEKSDALTRIQEIEFNEYKDSIKYPHFVFHIINQVEEKYGKEIVEQGGLKIYTTIDPNLQEIAEVAIEEGAERNTEKYNAKNASLVAIDPTTGEILAMVGSKDYFAEDIDGAVNVSTQYRQPGSSFKPFVYAQAFYNRYAPASVIFDAETRFGASAFPKNFDGKFMGPMQIRKALGNSRNLPAIKAYFLAGEQEPIIELGERMGLDFLDKDRDFGWPLGLGAAEVRQLDLVSAFGVFANTGVRHEPVSILKIENSKGELLEEWQPSEGEEVLDPQVAYLINNILSDTSVRLGENLTVSGHTNAAKTGTSNRKLANDKYLPHDLWTIGYTPSLVAGVWAGNNKAEDGELSAYAEGYSAAAPIWKKFMTESLKNRPSEKFPVPEGIKQVVVSTSSGKLPGPNTPEDQQKMEVFASFSVPTEVDDSYSEAEIDTRNNKLANEYCPEEYTKSISFVNFQAIAPYEEWEIGAQKWIEASIEKGDLDFGPNVMIGAPALVESDLCTKEHFNSRPEIEIRDPKDKDELKVESRPQVTVKITSKNKIEKVEYYLDGTLQYTTKESPYTGKIRLPMGETYGQHTITAKAFDIYGYSEEDSINIVTSKNPSGQSAPEPEPDEESEETADLPPALEPQPTI